MALVFRPLCPEQFQVFPPTSTPVPANQQVVKPSNELASSVRTGKASNCAES